MFEYLVLKLDRSYENGFQARAFVYPFQEWGR
jgi:hypothetical protein